MTTSPPPLRPTRPRPKGVSADRVRGGSPVAVMMPYPEYEQLMRQHALAAHRDLVIALGQAAERQRLTEKQLLRELEQSKRQAYEKRYGRARQ